MCDLTAETCNIEGPVTESITSEKSFPLGASRASQDRVKLAPLQHLVVDRELACRFEIDFYLPSGKPVDCQPNSLLAVLETHEVSGFVPAGTSWMFPNSGECHETSTAAAHSFVAPAVTAGG